MKASIGRGRAFLPWVSVLLIICIAACAGDSTEDYLQKVSPLAEQYNSARDVLDKAARTDAIATSMTLDEAKLIARGLTIDLENAVEDMRDAYKEFGALDVPEKFHDHQEATLSAWRTGIEAGETMALYFRVFLGSPATPSAETFAEMDNLTWKINGLFLREDNYQLDARRALRAADNN